MAKKKTSIMQWVFGLGLALMTIFFMFLAVDVFMPRPEYTDYCNANEPIDYNSGQPLCSLQYESGQNYYNFKIFLIFMVIGLILVIVSLFLKMTFLEVATLFSGFILMIIGMARNFDNKQQALISSVIIIGLLIFVGIKKLKVR
jgi:hypothetical protein